jgi:site-specific recombinase XerD
MKLNARTPLHQAIDAFLADLELAGKAERTLRDYRSDLDRLCRTGGALVRAGSLATLASQHLRELRLAQRSWNRHLSTLRQFCDYLVELQALPRNPLRGISQVAVDSGAAKPASSQLLAALFERIDRVRDRALIALLVSSGLQIGEALKLKVSDVAPGARFIRVRGSHRRTVELGPAARPVVIQYLQGREGSPNEPLFVGHGSRPLSYSGAHRIFRSYAANSGLTMRHLRMNAATNAFRRGASLVQVQHMLGHVHAASTARYQVSSGTKSKNQRRTAHTTQKESKHG